MARNHSRHKDLLPGYDGRDDVPRPGTLTPISTKSPQSGDTSEGDYQDPSFAPETSSVAVNPTEGGEQNVFSNDKSDQKRKKGKKERKSRECREVADKQPKHRHTVLDVRESELTEEDQHHHHHERRHSQVNETESGLRRRHHTRRRKHANIDETELKANLKKLAPIYRRKIFFDQLRRVWWLVALMILFVIGVSVAASIFLLPTTERLVNVLPPTPPIHGRWGVVEVEGLKASDIWAAVRENNETIVRSAEEAIKNIYVQAGIDAESVRIYVFNSSNTVHDKSIATNKDTVVLEHTAFLGSNTSDEINESEMKSLVRSLRKILSNNSSWVFDPNLLSIRRGSATARANSIHTFLQSEFPPFDLKPRARRMMSDDVQIRICRRIPEEPNGVVQPEDCHDQRKIRIGLSCVTKCNAGFVRSGSKTKTCLSSGMWSGWETRCEAPCPQLQHPSNGIVSPKSCLVGDLIDKDPILSGENCYYYCNPGYKLLGSVQTTCQKNGRWSTVPSICKRTCAGLTAPENGHVVPSRCKNSWVSEESFCTFYCDDGFVVRGEMTTSCLGDGTWTSEVPYCSRTCPKLSQIPHAKIHPSVCWYGKVDAGMRCIFECARGYELIGIKERTCDSDGQWSGEDPSCTKMCPPLKSGENLLFINECGSQSSIPGTKCIATCETGFRVVGQNELLCQQDGSWNIILPFCSAVCVTLPEPDVGHIVCSGQTEGASCSFFCPDRHVLFGARSVVCGLDGSWSEPLGYCLNTCRLYETPAHGKIIPAKCGYEVTLSGQVCEFECEIGYSVSGPFETTCLDTGEWSQNTTVCVKESQYLIEMDMPFHKTCLKPNRETYVTKEEWEDCIPGVRYTKWSLMPNRLIRNVDANKCLSVQSPSAMAFLVAQTCDPSNPLQVWDWSTTGGGEHYLKLKDHDIFAWEGYTSLLRVLTIDSASHVKSTWKLYDVVTAKRSSFYGGFNNGMCPPLTNGPRGRWSPAACSTTGVDSFSFCSYVCSPGFFLVTKQEEAQCVNGLWSEIKTPECAEACPGLSISPGSLLSIEPSDCLETYVNEQVVCAVKCANEALLVGERYLICLRGGLWSFSLPRCMSLCPNLNITGIGSVIESHNCTDHRGLHLDGSTCEVVCHEGYSLSTTPIYHCSGGIWDNEPPFCKRKCDMPVSGVHAISTCPDAPFYTEGESCIFLCKSGYTLVGNDTITCLNTGRWSPNIPTCKRKCPSLGTALELIIEPEECKDPSNLIEGIVCRLSCAPGYHYAGSMEKTCLSSGEWSGYRSSCQSEKQFFIWNKKGNNTYCMYVRHFRYHNLFKPAMKLFENCNKADPLDLWVMQSNNKIRNVRTGWCLGKKREANYALVELYSCAEPASENWKCRLKYGRYAITDDRFLYYMHHDHDVDAPDIKDEDLFVKDWNDRDTFEWKAIDLDGNLGSICGISQNRCPDLNLIMNTIVASEEFFKCILQEGVDVGETCTVFCHNDPENVAGETGTVFRCLDNGIWSPDVFDCAEKTCPRLVLNPNSYVNDEACVTSSSPVDGSKICSIMCEDGYARSAENPYINHTVCLPNGKWSEPPPKCLGNCSIPSPPANGYISGNCDGNKTLLDGDVCEFSCDYEYEIIGSKLVGCIFGSWNDSLPICQVASRNNCPGLVVPQNGALQPAWCTQSAMTAPGVECTIACNANYLPDRKGLSKVICHSNGQWSGKLAKKCLRMCPIFDYVTEKNRLDFGHLLYMTPERCSTGDNIEGDRCYIHCNDYRIPSSIYHQNFPGYVECLATGEWDYGKDIYYQCWISASTFKIRSRSNGLCFRARSNGLVVFDDCTSNDWSLYWIPVKWMFMTKSDNTLCLFVDNNSTTSTISLKECNQYDERMRFDCGWGERRQEIVLYWSGRKLTHFNGSNRIYTMPVENVDRSPTPPSLFYPYQGVGKWPGVEEDGTICGVRYHADDCTIWRWMDKENMFIDDPCRGESSGYRHILQEVGSACPLSCDAGYTMVGSTSVRCDRARWLFDDGEPRCSKQCEPLTQPQFANTSGQDCTSKWFKYGEICEQNCQENFLAVDHTERFCRVDGDWAGVDAFCYRQCPPIKDKHGAKVEPPSCTTSLQNLGNVCLTICNNGYKMVGKDSQICQRDGTWSNPQGVCEASCPSLPPITHGNIAPYDCTQIKKTPGKICVYACDTGYSLAGSKARTCRLSSLWNGTGGRCLRSCPPLTEPENGALVSETALENVEGAIVKITCKLDFNVDRNPLRECLSTGEWSGGSVNCVRESQFVLLQKSPPSQTICVYTDEISQVLVRPSVECDQTPFYLWAWHNTADIRNVGANKCLKMSSTSPEKFLVLAECDQEDPAQRWICSDVDNRNLLTLQDYRLVPVYSSLSSTKILLLSEELIEFLSRTSIAPLVHLQWLAKTSESNQTSLCTARDIVNCPKLEMGRHLEVKPSECEQPGVAIGAECVFSCKKGYIMKENVDSAVCLNSGYWTTTPPECIPSCGKLALNGSVMVSPQKCSTFEVFHEGEICQFHCQQNDILVGDTLLVCMRNGRWSSLSPVCRRTCKPLKIPIYGRALPEICAQQSRRIPEGIECVLSCQQKEHILTGSEKRTCTEDGTWSGYDSECIKPCNEVPNPANAVVSPLGCVYNKSPVGAICSFQCTEGFLPAEKRYRSCLKNGTWSGKPTVCEAFCNTMNDTVEYGILYPLSCAYEVSKPGTVCGVKCNSGFDIVGHRTICCTTGGSWSSLLGECKRRCPLLQKPLHGTLNPASCLGQDMFVGMSCSPACRRDFILKGSEVRTCIETGEWTGTEAECVPGCPAIGNIESATVLPKSCVDSPQPLKGTCVAVCVEGTLTGNWGNQTVLTCLVSGFWDRPIPTRCLRKCEVPEVPNGQITCDGGIIKGEVLEEQKCTVKCASYHVPTLHPVSTCVARSWSPRITSCAYTPYPLLMVQRVDLDTRCLGVDGANVVMHPWKICREEVSGSRWSWKSRYSIVNLFTGLCLTAFSKGVDEPLIVSPCDEDDPLQHWDCAFDEPYRIFLRNTTLGPGLRYSEMDGVTLQEEIGPNSLFYTFNPNSDDELGTLCSMRPEKGCPNLLLHGRISVSPQECSYVVVPTDTICYLSCLDENSSVVGAWTIECTGSGLWSPETPGKCLPSCPTLPPLPGNASFTDVQCLLTPSAVGYLCAYACPDGYVLQSDFVERECLETGIWSEVGSIQCKKECQLLESPPNGKLFPPTCSVDRCVIECDIGYRRDGPRIRICEESGKWSGTEFACIEDVQFTVSTKIHVLQMRMCLAVVDSNKVVKEACQQNKKSQMWRWKSHYALENVASETCLTLRAEDTAKVQEGKVSEDFEVRLPSIAYFRNSTELSDVHVVSCNASNPSQRWKCETYFPKNRFRVLLVKKNSYLDSGPQFTGRITLTPKPYRSSRWAVSDHEGIATLCSRRTTGICSPLHTLHGGVITPSVCQSEFIKVGMKCHFRCLGEFVIEGHLSTVCRKDGFWTNEPPVCVGMRRCSALKVKPPLVARPPICEERRVSEGRTCNFHCPDTHLLYGRESMLCGESLTWSDELPQCRFYCPGLPHPVNGFVSPESCQVLENEVGKNCTFSCMDGFDVIGSKNKVCEENGLWSGTRTVCRRLCSKLVAPLHATITPKSCLVNKSTDGAVCTAVCEPGFRLVGSPITACYRGTWSDSLPSCSGDTCFRYSMELAGIKSMVYSKLLNDAIVRGTVLEFECLSGFRAVGDSTRLCGEDGVWIGHDNLCVAITCKTLQRLYHGSIEPGLCTSGPRVGAGTLCSFSCDEGFILRGPASSECFPLGKWSEEISPQCHDTFTNIHPATFLAIAIPSKEDDMEKRSVNIGKCVVAQKGKDKSPIFDDCYPTSPFKIWHWYGSSRIQNVGNHLCWELNSKNELQLDKCNLNITNQEVHCGDVTSKTASLQLFVHKKLLHHHLGYISNVTTTGSFHWIAVDSKRGDGDSTTDLLTTVHLHGSPMCSFMCGGLLTSNEGDFSTPNFPQKYPSDITCKWTISVPKKNLYVDFSLIKLSKKVDEFEIETRCSVDNVKIFEGDNGNDMRTDMVLEICKAQKDLRVKTLHGVLHIELHSDHHGEDNQEGFAAKWFLEELPSILPSCGISELSESDIENATSRGYPWQVAIVTWKRLCDGVFIEKRFVLTSAHCVEHIRTADEIVQTAVAYGIRTQKEFVTKVKRRQWDSADRLWVHTGYNREFMINNIAVLRLSRGIRNFEDSLHPICMPLPEAGRVERPGYHCVVSGFSKGLVNEPSQTWRFSRMANAMVLSKKSCETLLLYERGVTFDDSSFLCAELFFRTDSSLPTMQGRRDMDNDGGSVLQCLWNENWYIVGVFNFPLSDVKDGIFHVFTKVIKNQQWIQNIVENGFLSPSNIFK